MAALQLQQFQYNPKTIFLRRLVFPLPCCQSDPPPMRKGIAVGGGTAQACGSPLLPACGGGPRALGKGPKHPDRPALRPAPTGGANPAATWRARSEGVRAALGPTEGEGTGPAGARISTRARSQPPGTQNHRWTAEGTGRRSTLGRLHTLRGVCWGGGGGRVSQQRLDGWPLCGRPSVRCTGR